MINNEFDIYEYLKQDSLLHIVALYETLDDL
jgi:hypothetical protein